MSIDMAFFYITSLFFILGGGGVDFVIGGG